MRLARRCASLTVPWCCCSLAVVIESGAFGDTLPSSADALTGAYVAALRRCSARVASHGTVPPSHAALLAAEGCLLHKAHAALLGASVAATCEVNLEFREGCSLLAARIATPQELDLAPALAHLAEMQSCTLPLCVCAAIAAGSIVGSDEPTSQGQTAVSATVCCCRCAR